MGFLALWTQEGSAAAATAVALEGGFLLEYFDYRPLCVSSF